MDFHFTFYIQENQPRFCLDPKLGRRGLGIARHLAVMPRAADGFTRFLLRADFVSFEVYDAPA